MHRTTCCIVGGGPAGVMLGYLLARAGVDVTVLEKHADFFRDFRGDTIHSSTLEVMYELGILDDFLKVPHQEQTQFFFQFGDKRVPGPDLRMLPVHCKFVAFMPQWDFLDFIVGRAKAYPAFHLIMEAEVTDLVRDDNRVTGVIAQTPEGPLTVHADLVVGCDGRHSTVRAKAGLKGIDIGAPIDVLWMRVSRKETDSQQLLGALVDGRFMVMINRDKYWQCAYIIPKGDFESVQARGIESFRNDVLAVAPYLGDRVNELRTWDDIKLLTVVVDRLKQWWQPGLLCIGDSAHAMSPVGGIGINLAIQDAVAAANMLWAPLRERRLIAPQLAALQYRREPPTRQTQALQVFIQDRIINAIRTKRTGRFLATAGLLLRILPVLRSQLARFIGVGFLPEHVESPEIDASKRLTA